MVKRPNVRDGISLLAIAFIIWLPFHNKGSQLNETQNVSKSISITQKINEKTKNIIQQLPSENLTKPCMELKANINLLAKNQKPTLHWKNHFLEKDGIEYNLRVERDYNKQGFEVQKARLFKIDNKGLPIFLHEIILNSDLQLKELMKGYSYISDNSIESYNGESLLVEKEEQKVIKVTNLIENRECHFMAHHK